MTLLSERAPAAGNGRGAGTELASGVPLDITKHIQRLQRRLSAFALAVDVACDDVETVQRHANTLAGGFGLTDEERHDLNKIAARLFDAREVLG